MDDFTKIIGIIVAAVIGFIALTFLSAWITMLLWNWIVPIVIPGGQLVGSLTMLQAWGITVLTSILFKSHNLNTNTSSKD